MSTLTEIKDAAATLAQEDRRQLEEYLQMLRTLEEEEELQELYRINGVHPLPKREGPLVTTELVRQICDEEGI